MKRVLIVDDSTLARRTLRQLLESAGYTVEEARDGNEALEKYYLQRPDLVMMDIIMEGMNGLIALQKLRELDPQAEVIIATADIQKGTESEAMTIGASGFVTKPYNRERVLETVSRVLAGGVS
jgi:two-component system chemotaxis response regulator CheY